MNKKDFFLLQCNYACLGNLLGTRGLLFIQPSIILLLFGASPVHLMESVGPIKDSSLQAFGKNSLNQTGYFYRLNEFFEEDIVQKGPNMLGLRTFSGPNANLPSCKGPLTKEGLSQKEKDGILKIHNDLRGKIHKGEIEGLPRAKEMSKLTWNSSLENECRRWLHLCPDGYHHSHPNGDWQAFHYGQNMAWGQATIEEAATQWFDEYKPYVAVNVDPLIYRDSNDKETLKHNLGMIGHFTAMANAKTNSLGCYKVSAGLKVIPFKITYCCNYSPPGNILKMQSDGSILNVPAYEAVSESKTSKKSKPSDSSKTTTETLTTTTTEAASTLSSSTISENLARKSNQIQTRRSTVDRRNGFTKSSTTASTPRPVKATASSRRPKKKKSRSTPKAKTSRPKATKSSTMSEKHKHKEASVDTRIEENKTKKKKKSTSALKPKPKRKKMNKKKRIRQSKKSKKSFQKKSRSKSNFGLQSLFGKDPLGSFIGKKSPVYVFINQPKIMETVEVGDIDDINRYLSQALEEKRSKEENKRSQKTNSYAKLNQRRYFDLYS